MNQVYLYPINSEADAAYVLQEGSIVIEINPNNHFEIEKKNFIFGASEPLLANEDGFKYYRTYAVKISPKTKYLKIAIDSLKKSMSSYKVGLAVSRSVALELVKVNTILTHTKKEVEESEKESKEYSKIFAEVTNILIERYKKTKYPWLAKLSQNSKKTLTYASGVAFLTFDQKSSFDLESVQLDQFSQMFPAGFELCQQGEIGRELYILNQGKLRVLIDGTEIDIIKDRGSVVGEIALLLGEKRIASLQAVQKTVLTVVKKDNLKAFTESNPHFLRNMAVGLSRRLVQNCNNINDLTKMIDQAKKKHDYLPNALKENKPREEFKHLQEEIQKLYEKYDMEWLGDLVLEISNKELEIRKITRTSKR